MSENKFELKDSGKREEYKSGMVRDVVGDKIDYSLIYDGPMLKRWAEHLTAGGRKYSKRNWLLANGKEELDRFKESAARHFHEWMTNSSKEDSAAGVFFNINAFEYLKDKLGKENLDTDRDLPVVYDR